MISSNSQKQGYSSQQSAADRLSVYDTVLSQNPSLKSLFDFKTILFSSSQNKLTPEECDQIYKGQKKINLKTEVKFENGVMQLRRTNSEAQDALMKLKLMNIQARFKSAQRKQQNEEDFDYQQDLNDDEYEDVEDEDDLLDMDGEDDYDNDYYDDDDEEYERYRQEQDNYSYMGQDEEYYYKQMLRDMEEDIEKDIYQNQYENQYFEKKSGQKNYLSKQKEVLFKNTDKKEENLNSTNSKSKSSDNQTENKEESSSDEWEDEDDDEDEDYDDLEEQQQQINYKKQNTHQSRISQNQKAKVKFSSIKTCEEDYHD